MEREGESPRDHPGADAPGLHFFRTFVLLDFWTPGPLDH